MAEDADDPSPMRGSAEESAGRKPGRPPTLGFCTVCGQQVPRSKGVRSYQGAFLCTACARQTRGSWPSAPSRGGRGSKARAPRSEPVRRAPLPEEEEGEELMIRKNLTITAMENDFLERHQEINQSALFRHAIVTLMDAESSARKPRRRPPSEDEGP